MNQQTPIAAKPGASLPVICTIFFFSGFPALIYQLVWQRSLFAIYGINVESVTIVVTAFMLGLGLGSLAGGAVSRWLKLPLLTIFGLIEIGIGAYGYFSLRIFDAVGHATLGVGVWTTGLLTFGLVLVPTLLMGATLPILVAHLVRRTGNVGRSVGLLYFVNTFGSAAACFAVALVLMRELGQQGVVTLAAAMNGIVAIGALAAGMMGNAPTEPDSPASEAPPDTARSRFVMASVLVGITGFISLSYEIVWFRIFSFASGGSALAFALLLGSFLAGIAFGSLLARRWCTSDVTGRGLRALAGFVLWANVAGFLVAPFTSFGMAFVPWSVMLPLVAIASGMLGATFPLICHYGVPPNARAGTNMSYLYLANIAGSSGGSLITGFVLMHYLTTPQITVLLAVAGFGLSVLVTRLADTDENTRVNQVITAGVAGALVIGFSWALFIGFWERLQFSDKVADERSFEHIIENRHGVITVTQDGRIYGGGIYDGVFSTDLVNDRNMIVRPYSMAAFHENPREVLMIGLSSGSWAQVVANHPSVEKLTVIEINPGYLDVIRQYPDVASVLDNPKVEIVIDDGRRWLNRNPERKFDFIVMNTTFHWRAHATNLLSVEFLQLIRAHLNDGGAAIYNTTDSERVQRTACEVFPYVVRVINNVVVSDRSLNPDTERWARVLREYRVDGTPVLDLANEPDRKRLERLKAMPLSMQAATPVWWGMEDRTSILNRTESLTPVTDDNMGTEWDLFRN
ncbi:MAG: fused MFS/spermidine synthase [Planctomycetes bacterium]|nr:fused MFS/spermidine synthase [Planctomycetota bacterium]